MSPPLLFMAATYLLLLHAPDGHQVLINPDQIVSLHSKKTDKLENKLFVPGAECMVNTADGKFLAVIEPCSTIEQTLEKQK